MNKKEFMQFLDKHEKELKESAKRFDEHSRHFDKIMREIRAAL